jgi:CheY-like chemotaxis protein
MADRQRLKQILLNLIVNAIKYNRIGGTVVVSYRKLGQASVCIDVADTGPGIQPDHLDRLFTPFDRLGAERTDVEGTGVGLALSRRLAEAMGGTIEVSSVAGEGSHFWVTLPAAEDPVAGYERLCPDPAPDGNLSIASEQRLLYIEDNLSNLRLVERVLARHPGIKVVPAIQGRVGLELALETSPAVILLDLHLPDMDGEEVLRRLRSEPRTATTPVIILSADATPGQVERLLAGGADMYLTKPLDVSLLSELLGRYLPREASDIAAP